MTTPPRAAPEIDPLSRMLVDLLLVVMGLALLVVGVLVRAAVLWQYWEWFAVPIGAPRIGWHAMVGVLLIGTLALEGIGNVLVEIKSEVVPGYRDRSADERMFRDFASGLVRCGLMLALGLLFHHVVLS